MLHMPPHHDDFSSSHQNPVILRSPRSGRLEGRNDGHFRNSTRAIARLWTSSGPSTMRITRERAQA